MIFTFILILAPQTLFPFLASLRIALVAAVIAIASYLFAGLRHEQSFVRWTQEEKTLLILVGWTILSVPFSSWPGGSVAFLLELYFKTAAICWLLGRVIDTSRRLRQTALILCLMTIPLAFSGINQFRHGEFMASTDVPRIIGYEAPLTGNPNDLALMLNVILPLTVALVLSTERPWLRIGLTGIAVLSAFAIIATFSRAGFIALMVIILQYGVKFSKRWGAGWLVIIMLVMASSVPLLPAGYLERLTTIGDIESDPTGSAKGRWDSMGAAARLVLKKPLIGHGVGMDVLALNEEMGPQWSPIHTVYLQYAVDLGIPGLLLFISLLVTCLRSVRLVRMESAKSATQGELFYLAEAIEVSLYAFAMAAMFYPVAYHFYFYYLAGLAVAGRRVWEREALHSVGLPT